MRIISLIGALSAVNAHRHSSIFHHPVVGAACDGITDVTIDTRLATLNTAISDLATVEADTSSTAVAIQTATDDVTSAQALYDAVKGCVPHPFDSKCDNILQSDITDA